MSNVNGWHLSLCIRCNVSSPAEEHVVHWLDRSVVHALSEWGKIEEKPFQQLFH